MFRDMGWPEIILILLIATVIFGAGKLPTIGRDLGRSIREFRRGVRGELADDEKDDRKKTGDETVAAKNGKV